MSNKLYNEHQEEKKYEIKIKSFDFSKNITRMEVYQYLCNYYNEINNNFLIVNEEKSNFDKNKIQDFCGKKCFVKLKNNNIYIGLVDLLLYDFVENINESISVLFLGRWIQLYIDDIKAIKMIEY